MKAKIFSLFGRAKLFNRRACLIPITFTLCMIYFTLINTRNHKLTLCGVEHIQKNFLGNITANNRSSIIQNITFPIGKDLCKQRAGGADSVWLLIAVLSKYEHIDHRQTIRETWGSVASSYTHRSICVIFIVGSREKKKDTKLHSIGNESQVYSDILQINKEELYNNIIYKTLGMLKWANSYLPKVKFILKIDDDVILNVQNLLHRLTLFVDQPKFIMGHIGRHNKPFRTLLNKYYVSEREYPHDEFPNYAYGPSYVISGDLVLDLLQVIPKLPPLRMEDVFVTGIASSYTSAVHVGRCGFLNRSMKPDGGLILSQYTVTMHSYSAEAQMKLWKAGITNAHRPVVYSEIFNM